MLTRAQQILIKRAQAEAGLDDADYRGAISVVSGLQACNSSTDARLSDEHMDRLLAYFEAIYWQSVDAGEIIYSYAPGRVFSRRNYWASKNTRASNSRDRFTEDTLRGQIVALEAQLTSLGCSLAYLQGIQNRVRGNQTEFNLVSYLAALKRTLRTKGGAFSHE